MGVNRVGAAYVDIGANLAPLTAGLGQAHGMLKKFGGLAGGLIGVGTFAAAGKGLLEAAKKASSLGESLNKVQVTFGASSGGIVSSSDKLAKTLGVVKREALDAAAAFGLMAQAGGLSQAASAEVANNMVQLGIDLASFHNIGIQEAFEKLRSGMAGESEPLRPLGILLSEDAVKAEALAMGLISVKRELTEQEKVLARISVIRKGAGPAVGDAARTMDSAQNQMKQLAADLENSATTFGEGLIGALQSGLKLAHEIGDALSGGVGGVGGAGGAVGGFGKAAIDAARTALAGGKASAAGLLGMSALAGVAGAIQTGPTQGLAKFLRDVMERQIAEGGAAGPMAAGPANVAGNALRAQQAAAQQANLIRDQRDAARAQVRLNEDFQKGLGGLAMGDAAGNLLQAMGLGGTLAEAAARGGGVGAINAGAAVRREQNTLAALEERHFGGGAGGGPGAPGASIWHEAGGAMADQILVALNAREGGPGAEPWKQVADKLNPLAPINAGIQTLVGLAKVPNAVIPR